MPCFIEEVSHEGLYLTETFIPEKRRATLKSIQDAFGESAARSAEALERKDYAVCCLATVYKFYEMYYNNDVPTEVDAVVSQALAQSASRPLEEAAPLLDEAMQRIMDGDLEDETPDDTPDAASGDGSPTADGTAKPTPLQRQAMTGVLLQSGFLERYMKHMHESGRPADAGEHPEPKQTDR